MQKTETTNPFKRIARVGFEVLTLEVGQTAYLKITAQGEFETRAGDTIPYIDVVDLQTGVEQRMWVDGGLKGTFSQLGGIESAVGKAFEITRLEQKAIELDGEKVKVNQYKVYEVEAA